LFAYNLSDIVIISVAVRVISAPNRTIEVGDQKFKLIQTDAAISPGNSVGIVMNAYGRWLV
jgi:serine protease Do